MADRKITALTELTEPEATDVFPIIDVSEGADANKNKKIQLTTILKKIPDGTVASPSVSFLSDTGVTGFFRVDSNEIGISANQTLIGSFTTTGFQLGAGTPVAQLHLFSSDTTDQVIIENTDTGLDNAPDLVLFRNSSSPAAADNLGNLVFRGKDDGNNDVDYASVVAQISDTANASEDGILDIMTMAAGTLASRIRLISENVGINETAPANLLHITNDSEGATLRVQSISNSAGSGGDIVLTRTRGASGAGQDNDVLSTIFFEGNNDNASPEDVDYAAIEAKIIDASDSEEDGQLNLQVVDAGTLTTIASIQTTGINVTGTVTDDGATHDGDVTFTGASANIVFDKSDNALEFADNSKLQLGDSQDLSIFHNGSHSFIQDSSTGSLFVLSNSFKVNNADSTANMIVALENSFVKLFFDGSEKLVTTSTGIEVTKEIKIEGAAVNDFESGRIRFNETNSDFNGGYIHYDGSANILKLGVHPFNDAVVGNDVDCIEMNRSSGSENVELNFAGAKKAETTSSGLTVTGTVTETSDVAFKSDIKPITDTLDKLQQITGYKYKLDNASIDSMGVIAQDVEKVFPELVHGNEGSKTLQYSGLIGVLVEAVKDLSAKIKVLESS